MVLARRIGVIRPFPLVLLLYVGTFGLYGLYWHYKAHHEVFRQFELDLEERNMGLVWLLLDRAFFPLRWIYQYGFVDNLSHVRQRMGLPPGIRPSSFLWLAIPGSTLSYMATVLAVFGLGGPYAQMMALIALGCFALGASLSVPAFWLLQSSLNEAWLAFDHRMDEIMPRSEAWRPIPPSSA